jgi:hypothetical protein
VLHGNDDLARIRIRSLLLAGTVALGVLVTSLATLGKPLPAQALATYLTQFTTSYPAAALTKLNSCVLCHPGSVTTQTNSYASDFAAASHNFAAIEAMDSDGDGFTNIVEINAGTWPGDATDHPAVGPTPTVAPTPTSTPAPVVEQHRVFVPMVRKNS